MTLFRKTAKTALYLILVFGILGLCGLVYLYRHGGKDNYFPPNEAVVSPASQVTNDLTLLSQAVESYYVKNMRYPKDLEGLKPEFISKLPVAPVSNTFYLYETNGTNRYAIRISGPEPYNLKEMQLENGKFIKN